MLVEPRQAVDVQKRPKSEDLSQLSVLERSNLQVLAACRKIILPSGDIAYESEADEPKIILLLNPRYEALLPDLLRIINITSPGLSEKEMKDLKSPYKRVFSVVLKRRLGRSFGKKPVAIKLLPDFFVKDFKGIDQFQAIRTLQEEGFLCAEPVFATSSSIVTEWVIGKKPETSRRRIKRDILGRKQVVDIKTSWYAYKNMFEKVVLQLREQGKWKQDWKPDSDPSSFRIASKRLQKAGDIRTEYICLDPVELYNTAN